MWHRTWFFTLPLVRHVLAIVTLGNFVVVFNSFPIIFIMTGGGPVNKTDIFATEIYSKAFAELDFGYASALAIIVSVLLLALSLVYVRLVVNRAHH
jgi:multiple sugar transport system permease protein